LGYAADHAQRDARLVGRHKVPSSKNPVKVQVLVGPDKSLGAFALATVQGLPWQAQEALQTIPFELLNPCFCAVGRADYVELAIVHCHIDSIRQQLINLPKRKTQD
jgi:hypothetical protein